jgi:signal transduction histidine kinase
VVAAGIAIATAAAVVGQLADARAAPPRTLTFTAAIAVAFGAMAALVLRGVPGHRVGRLMAAAGALAGVELVAASWAGALPLAWLSQWAWWPPFGLIFLALLHFPDGRLPSTRWRPLAALLICGTAAATAALAVAALDAPRTLLTDLDAYASPRTAALMTVAVAAAALTVAGLVGVVAALWARWRRAHGETRQQLACLLPAGILLVLGLVVTALGLEGAWLATAVVVPVAMTVAILRYHLYRLDVVVNRAVVWLLMTLLVIAGFVAIVAVLRTAFVDVGDSNASLVATGLVAVTFEPLRRRVQRGVNQMLYGDRDDPYKVIADLGDLLGCTVDPNAVLPRLAETIAASLRVPYVAVEASGPDGPRLLAEHGGGATTIEAFDMVAHGERVGRLLVATRSPHGHFTPRERELLTNVALHAAVAAEATRLTRDLQDSRERLIMAREEERRRLRRDLHDGLGPALVGMSMQVQAAHRLVGPDHRAAAILDTLAEDLRSCTVEVRQVVDQLRPPALDTGLAAALRAECQRFTSPALCVRADVDGDLDGLPAAVEVAAFRIVGEALTNVNRHAHAGSCLVRVRRDRSLVIEIVDDGVGIAAPHGHGAGTAVPRRHGVGLASMRERATELGGSCEVAGGAGGGTAVRVRIPVPLGVVA